MAPNTSSQYSLPIPPATSAESDNDDDSFRTAHTSELDDNELALDIDNTMTQWLPIIPGRNYDPIDQRKRSLNEDEHMPPPAQRQKICDTSVVVPPEVWATTMAYLDFKSILSCAATSHSMLHEAIPLVTTIHIEKASEMNTIVSMRFRDVREVNIYSLLRIVEHEEAVIEFIIDSESSMRAIPYLCRFSKLERLFFGGKRSNGDVVGFNDGFIDEDEDDNEAGKTLLDMISAAYRCQTFSKSLCLSGLRCMHSNTENNLGEISGCSVCQRACRSFPLDQVINFENDINFENEGSYQIAGTFYSNRSYTLDVCLTRSEIESIVEARPGGNELLRSNARLLYLLSRGSRYVVPSEDGSRAFYVVKYSKRELSELERVITYSQLDVKKCSRADLTRAIMRSFAGSDRQTLPPKDQCYLAGASFYYLKEKIGLDICVEDFSFKMRLVSLPLICKVVTSDASIKADCFDLLYVFVTDLGTQAIQYLIDKKFMPTLVQTLVRTIGEFADRSNSTTSSTSDEYVLSKYNSILSTARAVSTAIMKHILLLDESTLKRMDTKTIEGLRRELHRLYKDMSEIKPTIVVVTEENSNNDGVGSGDGVKLLYEYFAFWRELSLRLITSSSLPLRLFGWDEVSTLITESERARPIPRAYMVSGAGTEWINGLYEFDSKRLNRNGLYQIQYHMTIRPPNDDGGSHHGDGGVVVVDDDSSDAPQQQHHLPQPPPMAVVVPLYQTDIPSRGHGSASAVGRLRMVTLFRCTMRSSQKWWFLSECDEHQPGTDRDVDYYQHKSKREEERLPSKAGWVTCRAGSDPPPTLEAVGILEPRGEEYNTLEHQLARWAKDNGVIELVLGDGIHPEVVSRSAGLIKFLAGMSREVNNETSSTRS